MPNLSKIDKLKEVAKDLSPCKFRAVRSHEELGACARLVVSSPLSLSDLKGGSGVKRFATQPKNSLKISSPKVDK